MKTFSFPILLLSHSALAHHGQDFFLNLDTRTPARGSGASYLSSGFNKNGGSEYLGLESGVLLGLGGGFAAGVAVDLSDEEVGSFQYRSFAPLLQWGFAIPDSRFRIGASASYRFADESRTSFSNGHSHTSSSPLTFPTLGGNPDAGLFNPDAPAGGVPLADDSHDHGAHGHGHGGIHRHGEDFFTGRLILEWQATESTLAVFNFITVAGAWDDIALGYSVGIRQMLDQEEKFAVGWEAIGDLSHDGEHNLAAGLYYTPRHDLTLRLGVGTGIGEEAADFTLLSGLTFRF